MNRNIAEFTESDRAKLDSIEEGAQRNVDIVRKSNGKYRINMDWFWNMTLSIFIVIIAFWIIMELYGEHTKYTKEMSNVIFFGWLTYGVLLAVVAAIKHIFTMWNKPNSSPGQQIKEDHA